MIVLLRARGNPDIPHETIQHAIQQRGVEICLELISQYMGEYVFLTSSHEDTARLMRLPYIIIDGQDFAMIPLMPGYGSNEYQVTNAIPPSLNLQPQLIQNTDNRQPLDLVVHGLPPLFWGQPILVSTMFRGVCPISDVRLRVHDLAFEMRTYARSSSIPRHAHVGILRNGGRIINIWPIWIDVHPGQPDPPTLQQQGNCMQLQYNLAPIMLHFIF